MEDTTLFKKSEMKNKIRKIIGVVRNLKHKSIISNKQDNDLVKMLKEAHDEWKNSENFFEYVTEPDLIDYAIFKMEAARIKYIYLLKQVRKKGIKVDI
jgi:hypothetical protein